MVKGLGTVLSMYNCLMGLQKAESESVGAHVKNVLRVAGALKQIGESISNTFIVACIFRSLSPSYNQLVVVLDSNPKVNNIPYITVHLINFEATYSGDSTLTSDTTALTVAAAERPLRRAMSEITYYRCQALGHFFKDCTALNPVPCGQTPSANVAALSVFTSLETYNLTNENVDDLEEKLLPF